MVKLIRIQRHPFICFLVQVVNFIFQFTNLFIHSKIKTHYLTFLMMSCLSSTFIWRLHNFMLLYQLLSGIGVLECAPWIHTLNAHLEYTPWNPVCDNLREFFWTPAGTSSGMRAVVGVVWRHARHSQGHPETSANVDPDFTPPETWILMPIVAPAPVAPMS